MENKKQRGGARPGSGRKKGDYKKYGEKVVHKAFYVPESKAEQVTGIFKGILKLIEKRDGQ